MHRQRSTLPLLIAAALVLAWARADGAVQVTSLSFQSAGRPIAVERFAPAGGPGHRSVVVLHGAGGTLFDGPEMRRVARRLAEGGDEAYFIHYFDRTGTFFGLDKNMQEHFEEWLSTVRDALAWAQAQRGAKAPVGVFGYSLGAFLAVAAASDNPRVGAVVEQSGGIWNSQRARVGRLPATLLIHGRRDQRVPFDKYAVPLLGVVRRKAAAWKTRYYPAQGHVFDAAGRASVREQAARWFAKHAG